MSATDNYTETETYGWTLDAEGYPTRITIKEISEWNTSEYSYEFGWEADLSGVAGVEADVTGVSKFYNVHGLEVGADAKGLVIERRADGSVVKSIRR